MNNLYRRRSRAAGRKGGERVSTDRAHMSRIGRLGGKRSAGRRATKVSPDETDSWANPHRAPWKLRRQQSAPKLKWACIRAASEER